MTEHELYQEWFRKQEFYNSMLQSHGDMLFIKDGDVYRKIGVRIGFTAWKEFNQQQQTDEVCEAKKGTYEHIEIHTRPDSIKGHIIITLINKRNRQKEWQAFEPYKQGSIEFAYKVRTLLNKVGIATKQLNLSTEDSLMDIVAVLVTQGATMHKHSEQVV